MRVTLVFCAVGVAGFNPNWPNPRPVGDREGSWIGHGIASVGASVKATGHEVNLIDLRQLRDFKHFEEIITSDPAEVYGLSVSAVDEFAALKAIYGIKTHVPKAKIVIGGIMPSIFPEKFAFDVVDCVVQGEGELTFPKILDQFARGEKPAHIIKGEKPHLDSIPYVDRELFEYRRELDCFFAPDQKTPSVTMLAGRGCPYHCNYCQPAENAVFGKPYRMRSPMNVINELNALRARYEFKSITFWDDTFTFRPDWIEKFCDLYQANMFRASIAACSRADIIVDHEPMIERLASIGLDWFVIGLESGSQRLLDFIKKGTTVLDNLQAVKICKRYGIKVFGTFMLGLPTETRAESEATINMVKRMEIELASPFIFRPIPGTGIYDYCEQNDLILQSTKDSTIARTGVFAPTIKGVDYDHINRIMPRVGEI